MPDAMKIKRGIYAGEPVYLVHVNNEHVATIAKTGSTADNYPWSYWFIKRPPRSDGIPTGRESTKHDCVNTIRWFFHMEPK